MSDQLYVLELDLTVRPTNPERHMDSIHSVRIKVTHNQDGLPVALHRALAAVRAALATGDEGRVFYMPADSVRQSFFSTTPPPPEFSDPIRQAQQDKTPARWEILRSADLQPGFTTTADGKSAGKLTVNRRGLIEILTSSDDHIISFYLPTDCAIFRLTPEPDTDA